MIYKKPPASGFTLAEIIVSTLLLSIFALGSFKTFHSAQFSANSAFTQYFSLNQHKQQYRLAKLQVDYPISHIDPSFPLLKCLVEQGPECAMIPQ